MKRVLAVVLAAGAVVGCRNREEKAPTLAPIEPKPATQATVAPQPQAAPEAARPTTQQAPAPVAPPPAPVAPPVVITPPLPKPAIIATVDGIEIPRDRVVQLVMESHGLNMLLRVAQVEMARAVAAKEGMTVSPEEVKKERAGTLLKMSRDANQKTLDEIAEAKENGETEKAARLRQQFEKDAELILQQTLARENMTLGEFELLMEANACLRKVVEKQLAGKLTEDNLREAFSNIYGENIRVRHIELANMSEVSDAQKRLEAGVPFPQVAKMMSRNAATKSLGGELLPFSRETQGIPESFRQVAFTLKTAGEISEPVEANGSYHLIQLVERIAPKAVKFEDVKESVRQQLFERWVTERMKVMRDQLARKALETLTIKDPALTRQFNERVTRRDTELKEREQIARQLSREREQAAAAAAATATTTQPAGPAETVAKPAETPAKNESPAEPTAPAPAPATEPMKKEDAGKLRPPASESGSDTPDQQPTTTTQSQSASQSPATAPAN